MTPQFLQSILISKESLTSSRLMLPWRVWIKERKSIHDTFTLNSLIPPVKLHDAEYIGLFLESQLTSRSHISAKRRQLGIRQGYALAFWETITAYSTKLVTALQKSSLSSDGPMVFSFVVLAVALISKPPKIPIHHSSITHDSWRAVVCLEHPLISEFEDTIIKGDIRKVQPHYKSRFEWHPRQTGYQPTGQQLSSSETEENNNMDLPSRV